jgi:hypothetical protein
VKTTPCVEFPAAGLADGETNANDPATFAAPPVNTELESAWPKVIAEAEGKVEITAPALETETVTFAVAVV